MTDRRSLDEKLRDEARELADTYGVPYERVYECEMAMFCHHAATGDDLDCRCGAHKAAGDAWLAANPQRVAEYRPEDFG